ncbi:branched-chain amino acid ABC transporter permease/ATP-binding protein [Frankia sp. CiP3]|uniref:branched-chain amino acid ABC transporter permease/ATP-binding protein n=1 Tax=Frankia sp. CiP3 TaxID=2880971 RepID=UPI001EF64F44|nr:branched-chain amino acid ABC transporter permease/ATP-binding protein [Frankia sp. CiP3]
MTVFAQFGLLGLGSGALIALLGIGLVLVYRGSGTINFAQGSFALLGAYVVHELRDNQGMPAVPAVAIAAIMLAAVGVLVQILLMRPLRARSPLVRVIATLGVLSVIQQSVTIRYTGQQLSVATTLPEEPVHLGSVIVGQQSFWLTGIAVAVTAGLTVLSSRTRLGLAVSAAAANQRAAAALGFSPDALACGTWALGGALAGLAGAFFPSLTGDYLSVNALAFTIIAALAAALLGGFRSYPLVLVGGLLIGVIQSECTHYVRTTGVPDSVPFLVIVLVLVVRGQGLPVRGSTADRLPAVSAAARSPLYALGLAAGLAVLAAAVLPTDWNVALVSSMSAAMIALSVVVVTGYAGQLSLAQFALGGVGAFAAGRLVSNHGWPFEAAVPLGVATAVAVGFGFGLPALRTRGVNLAVVTLGLGFASWSLLFNSTDFTGRNRGTPLSPQTLLGIPIDPVLHPGSYAALCVVSLAVVAVAVANLRRGRSGRRLLAVRANERAAASLGISVIQSKLYAFSLGAAIAGLGGILYAFSFSAIQYTTLFDPFTSITILTLAVIGGIGYVSGPLYGSTIAAAGLGALLLSKAFGSVEEYLPLVGGVLLLLLLLSAPDGLAGRNIAVARQLRHRIVPSGRALGGPRDAGTVPARALEIRNVTVRFGGVVALDNVDLTVPPATVIGILGPNGAGKTTLIDAVTGYAQPAAGSVSLGGRDIGTLSPHLRAREGLCRSFQSLELFDDMTVRENLLAAADPHDRRAWLRDLVRPGGDQLPAGVVRAVRDMGLEDVLDVKAESLSYGQRRSVAIARSLAAGPSVLLLDEPAAGLDQDESRALGELLRRLADERGIGVLLIEHDVAMVMRTADRVLVLESGRQIAQGTPSEIRSDPVVAAAYLGSRATHETTSAAPHN